MRQLIIIALFICVSGCQWVKPSDAGKNVALVKPIHVQNCQKIGNTTSTVKDKVGFIERKERKVADELITLAKNEAATINGDTIVAKGEMKDGRQSFDIYTCQSNY